jgi:DNA polymerase-3 subunit delta'
LILIGTSPARQLPTIRSRSQVVRFKPLDQQTVVQILTGSGLVGDEQQAARAAELSGGSVEGAVQLADPELWKFRELLISELRAADPDSVRLGRSVQAFVDGAGKEAAPRRERLRIIIGFALEFHRAELTCLSGTALEQSVQSLDIALAALEYVDRNANLSTVIQNWCEESAAIRMGRASSMLMIA